MLDFFYLTYQTKSYKVKITSVIEIERRINMGRKEKFTKEYLLSKSVNYIREYELTSLSAREITKYIGCSTQIIFKYYKTMNEFKNDLLQTIYQEFQTFCQKLNNNQTDLFANSFAYLIFSKKEPNLFKALFINKEMKTNRYSTTIEEIAKTYDISQEKAKYYQELFFYIHGIACLLCIDKIRIKDNDLYNLLKAKIKEIND